MNNFDECVLINVQYVTFSFKKSFLEGICPIIFSVKRVHNGIFTSAGNGLTEVSYRIVAFYLRKVPKGM